MLICICQHIMDHILLVNIFTEQNICQHMNRLDIQLTLPVLSVHVSLEMC
uniref:Uncharacterized protein n=1 Tax=Arundo donax TaxID=35708 RepID=A0A0A8XT03_ARUDO